MSKAKDPKKLIKNLSGKIKVAATKLKGMREELKELKMDSKAGQAPETKTKSLRGSKAKNTTKPSVGKVTQGRRGRPKKQMAAQI